MCKTSLRYLSFDGTSLHLAKYNNISLRVYQRGLFHGFERGIRAFREVLIGGDSINAGFVNDTDSADGMQLRRQPEKIAPERHFYWYSEIERYGT